MPTPTYHWRAQDITQSGGLMTGWPAHVGGVNLTPFSGGEPGYNATGMNSLPVAVYTNADDSAENTSADLLSGATAYTIAMVLRRDDMTDQTYPLFQDDGGGYRFAMTIYANGYFRFFHRTGDTGAQFIDGGAGTIVDDTNYIIIVRVDYGNTLANLTINGTEISTPTPTGTALSTSTGTGGIVLGNWKTHAVGLDGVIAQCAIWNSYLSDSDLITEQYNLASPYGIDVPEPEGGGGGTTGTAALFLMGM